MDVRLIDVGATENLVANQPQYSCASFRSAGLSDLETLVDHRAWRDTQTL